MVMLYPITYLECATMLSIAICMKLKSDRPPVSTQCIINGVRVNCYRALYEENVAALG